jgi:regulatory protein
MAGSPGEGSSSAYAVALRLLTQRPLTAGELVERLRRRGYPPDEIAEARRRTAELGYLDDRRAAASWAEAAARVRGLGPRRIREGLKKRRVGRDLAAETAEALFPAGEEERLAAAVLERWERSRGRATDPERCSRAYAHLRRRGFSATAARAALFKRPENV